MKTASLVRLAVSSIAGVVLSAIALAHSSDPLNPTLKVGDPAPAVTVMRWLKGKPVTKFEPGHVYVVEFWATWCAPCNRIMPHLSALQKKHSGRLTIIAINAREAEAGKAEASAVKQFVEKKGDQMAYTVAMDDPQKKTAFDAWMTAAGAYGIPTSFVVDGEGRMVWVGHPDGENQKIFEAAVERALEGKSDLQTARAIQREVNEKTDKRFKDEKLRKAQQR